MIEKYKDPEGKLPVALDCAVRDSQNKYKSGYTTKKGTTYCNYMSNYDWNKFLKSIKDCHKKQFDDGAGGELKEGENPPKMASFGSSSRFIYEESKDIEGFVFEEKLDTRVGGIAHLDGSRKKAFEYIYVEAKKREIYYSNSHKNEDIKEVYMEGYHYISDHILDYIQKNHIQGDIFSFASKESEKNEYKKITFKVGGDVVQYFDLKQLICHFLGITYDIAKHHIGNVKVKFLYLIYNPKEVIEKKANEYSGKIEKRYDEVTKFINKNIKNGVFDAIFQSVLDYQIKKQGLDNNTKIDFKMKLVDQTNYKDEVM